MCSSTAIFRPNEVAKVEDSAARVLSELSNTEVEARMLDFDVIDSPLGTQ